VVSACDPHRTFIEWLTGAPTQADDLISRWRAIPHSQGYESKVDAVMSAAPRYRHLDASVFDKLGIDPAACTAAIAPSLADMHRGYEMMGRGEILDRPGLLVNVPTVLDPTMAAEGKHVLSLEAIYTPYNFTQGWTGEQEPKRWMERYSSLVEDGFLQSIEHWRVMTPETYESEFNLPQGHATSFAGGPLAALRNKNPELTRYETPVNGLYITGAATFPGAGVWGASGRNAAMVVLRHR
jgi:phytoene dehydrogenase-like protein